MIVVNWHTTRYRLVDYTITRTRIIRDYNSFARWRRRTSDRPKSLSSNREECRRALTRLKKTECCRHRWTRRGKSAYRTIRVSSHSHRLPNSAEAPTVAVTRRGIPSMPVRISWRCSDKWRAKWPVVEFRKFQCYKNINLQNVNFDAPFTQITEHVKN